MQTITSGPALNIDNLKVRNLVRAVRRGEAITPICIWGSRAQQLTGCHRTAANALLEMLGDSRRIETVDFDDLSLDPEVDAAIIDMAERDAYDELDTYVDGVLQA